jgi:hypothetical protein
MCCFITWPMNIPSYSWRLYFADKTSFIVFYLSLTLGFQSRSKVLHLSCTNYIESSMEVCVVLPVCRWQTGRQTGRRAYGRAGMRAGRRAGRQAGTTLSLRTAGSVSYHLQLNLVVWIWGWQFPAHQTTQHYTQKIIISTFWLVFFYNLG